MSPFITLLTAIKKLLAFKVDRDEFRDVVKETKKDIEGIKNDIEDTKRDIEDIVEEVEGNIAQSDWNQNDESAADYVKNRPFYEDAHARNVFYEEQTITLQDGEYTRFEGDRWAEHGVEYTVVFDGVEYPVVCWTDSDTCMRLDFTHTSGAYITILDLSIMANGLAGEHTFAVYKGLGYIKRIDRKFMPEDMLQEISDLTYATEQKMSRYSPNGSGAFSMNRMAGTNIGPYSFAEGYNASVIGEAAHGEGKNTSASGAYSHTEGQNTVSVTRSQHVQGEYNIVSPSYAQVEEQPAGLAVTKSDQIYYCSKSYSFSSVTGLYTLVDPISVYGGQEFNLGGYYYSDKTSGIPRLLYAVSRVSVDSVEGRTEALYRYKPYASRVSSDNKVRGGYAHIVGNGTSDTARSNAHTLDWNGLGWFAGGLKVGGTGQDDESSREVALVQTDNEIIADLIDADMLPAVHTSGKVLTDSNGNVILRY